MPVGNSKGAGFHVNHEKCNSVAGQHREAILVGLADRVSMLADGGHSRAEIKFKCGLRRGQGRSFLLFHVLSQIYWLTSLDHQKLWLGEARMYGRPRAFLHQARRVKLLLESRSCRGPRLPSAS